MTPVESFKIFTGYDWRINLRRSEILSSYKSGSAFYHSTGKLFFIQLPSKYFTKLSNELGLFKWQKIVVSKIQSADMKLLIIALGGAIGSISRYGMQTIVYSYYPFTFPLGTFIVNIVGSILIGSFYALAERGNILTPEWRLFLTTGFCGGFTTFSTFAYENMNLMRTGEFLYSGLYISGSVFLGIAGVYLGITIIKLF